MARVKSKSAKSRVAGRQFNAKEKAVAKEEHRLEDSNENDENSGLEDEESGGYGFSENEDYFGQDDTSGTEEDE